MEDKLYMSMKCTSSDTEPLAAAFQTVSYALNKLAASVPVKAVFSTTVLILNGKRSVLASSIEFHSFMTIMNTCLILNRQKTMNMNDFFFVFSETFIDFINVDLIV